MKVFHLAPSASNILSDLTPPAPAVVCCCCREYEDFRVSSDGELHGVGLLIANEPYNNHLLVLGSIRGGPADRAGIVSGDEVLSINGASTDGWTGEMAAKVLRGQGGTEVKVKIARRTEGIPGVPGRPEPPLQVREGRVPQGGGKQGVAEGGMCSNCGSR